MVMEMKMETNVMEEKEEEGEKKEEEGKKRDIMTKRSLTIWWF